MGKGEIDAGVPDTTFSRRRAACYPDKKLFMSGVSCLTRSVRKISGQVLDGDGPISRRLNELNFVAYDKYQLIESVFRLYIRMLDPKSQHATAAGGYMINSTTSEVPPSLYWR